MITVTKTDTHGFRAERFRNQVVHQYYGHLQSVMHSIEPTDKYKNLFARPEIDGFSTDNTNIEWTSSLSGKPVHYSQLSDLDKQKVDGFIEEAFSRINRYVAEGKDKTGKEHDYSQFLSIVGKKPNPNQIWIVGGKPTIVQWGYNDDNNLMGSSGIYPNWDSFINEIKTIQPEEKAVAVEAPIVEKPVEPIAPSMDAAVVASPLFTDLPNEESLKNEAKPATEPKAEPKAIKPVAKPKKPVKKQEEKKTAMAGLGGYWWVKWLAIILLIIIIILLLLRFIPQAQNPFGQTAGMAGGPTVINGGVGGAGGIGGGPNGGAGGIGGGNEGGSGIEQGNGGDSGSDSSSSMKKSNPCKSCGGSGILKAGSKCSSCNGKGKTASGASCSKCSGTGKTQQSGKCPECTGSGIADDSNGNSNSNDTDIADNAGNNDDAENENDNDDDDFGIAGGDDSENSDADKADKDNVNPTENEDSTDSKSDESSSEDLCPICKCLFSQHSPEDLKKCLLSAQEGKEEMKKRLQKFVNEFGENAMDNVGE